MASALKNLSKYDESKMDSIEAFSFGIVVSDWNSEITHKLYEGAYDTLIKHGAKEDKIHTLQVPGAFELPIGARMVYQSKKVDAVICLGCVIKGETQHDEYINKAVASGLVTLGVSTGKAFVFGLLTTNDEQQAIDRSGGKHGNKGVEAAVTAIRMVHLEKGLEGNNKKIGFGG